MQKTKGLSLKGKIKIDLSGWELGDWPAKLAELIDVEIAHGSINIEIKPGDRLDAAARDIAEDAIKAFFDEEVFFFVRNDGIALSQSGDKPSRYIVPWSFLAFGDDVIKNAGAALKWIDGELSGADCVSDAVMDKIEIVRNQISKILETL